MSRQKTDLFTRFTSAVSLVLGKSVVFIIALGLLLAWAVSGPILGFSDTWQLIINTSTTVITFLTVFVIQNTQNRDNLALNLKIDALLEKNGIDDNDLFRAEDESDKVLQGKKEKIQKRKQ